MTSRIAVALTCCLTIAWAGCGDDDRSPADGGRGTDASTADGGPTDAGPVDGGTDGGDAEDAGASDMGDAADASMDGGTSIDAALPSCAVGVLAVDVAVDDTTIGATDARNPDGDDCLAAFASGTERVYAFTAPTSATYEVRVTPGNATFDPMLYVQPDCDDTSACLAVAGLNGPGGADSTDITLSAGETVLVTVDTDFRSLGDTEGGPFTLRVTEAL